MSTPGRDRETRDRLLTAAARLFSTRGFARVTVRDICEQAHANVAAVNYHFGGKTGLYEEVLRAAIETMQGTTAAVKAAGRDRGAEEQLEAYITIFLQRVPQARDSWIHQLMMRELTDPTPALDLVIEQVVHPRMSYLAGIVATLIGCEPGDSRVGPCVLSVHAQIHALLNSPMATRLFGETAAPTRAHLHRMARHITRFSLAGIRAIAAA